VDGWQGALQACGNAQLLEGEIGLFVQQHPELALVAGDNTRLPSRTVMLRAHVAQASPLLQELLNHAQRHPETAGHRFAAALTGVIGSQNPFPQIQGDCLHPSSLPFLKPSGYSLI
jgi:hypothetical protein